MGNSACSFGLVFDPIVKSDRADYCHVSIIDVRWSYTDVEADKMAALRLTVYRFRL